MGSLHISAQPVEVNPFSVTTVNCNRILSQFSLLTDILEKAHQSYHRGRSRNDNDLPQSQSRCEL